MKNQKIRFISSNVAYTYCFKLFGWNETRLKKKIRLELENVNV